MGVPGTAAPAQGLTSSQIQGTLRGLRWAPSPTVSAAAEGLALPRQALGGPPTWDIKVSQAEDKPNPMETPQTLTNWRHTRESAVCQAEPEGDPAPGGVPSSP